MSAALLAELLAAIERAEAAAAYHDQADGGPSERDHHAAAAQRADEAAETARTAARALIEGAFPGIGWRRIARAAL